MMTTNPADTASGGVFGFTDKSRHSDLIDDLCRKYGAERRNWPMLATDFLHECRSQHDDPLAPIEDGEDDREWYASDLKWWRKEIFGQIRPDAFCFDAAERLVTLFEVEVTNPVKQGKLDSVVEIWFYLDCESIDCRLVLVDRYGHERDVDLCTEYYRKLDRDIKARAEQ